MSEGIAHFLSVNYHIHEALVLHEFRKLEVLRQALAHGALDDSSSDAKLAVTPPVVGSVSTVIYRPPLSLWSFTAPDVLAICIRETIPSCILAPPEQVNKITGRLWSEAYSKALAIFSPTTLPMEPIM